MNRTLIGPSYGWIGARHVLCDGDVTRGDEMHAFGGEGRDEMRLIEPRDPSNHSSLNRGIGCADWKIQGCDDEGFRIGDEG